MARKLTKKELEALRLQQEDALVEEYYANKARMPNHYARDISDEEFEAMANNPWSTPSLSSTSTAAPEQSSSWGGAARSVGDNALRAAIPAYNFARGLMSEGGEGDLRDDLYKDVASTATNIGASVVDALMPDPNMQARDSTNPFQNAMENVIDVAARTPVVIDDAVRGAVSKLAPNAAPEAIDAIFSTLNPYAAEARKTVYDRQQDNIRLAREGKVLPARDNVFDRAADSMRGTAEALSAARTPEAIAAGQAMDAARRAGPWDTAKFLASGQGARALLHTAAGSAPYAALGGGSGMLLRGLGASATAAQAGAGAVMFSNLATAQAAQAQDAVMSLTPEEAMASPVISDLVNRGIDLEQAKRMAAAEARYSTIAQMVPSAPLYGLGTFEAMGAGAHMRNVLATLPKRTIAGTAREVGTEFVQESTEALAGNVGEIAAGIRSEEDRYEGVLGSGIVGAAAAGPLAAGTSYAAARSDFSRREAEGHAMADRLAREEQARKQVQEEETRAFEEGRSSGTLADNLSLANRDSVITMDGGTGWEAEADTEGFIGPLTEEHDLSQQVEAAEQARELNRASRQFLSQNTLESSNAALDNSLKEGPRWSGMDTPLLGTPEQRREENRRLAAGVANEQLADEQLVAEAEAERVAGEEAAATLEAQTAEAREVDAATTKADLKAATQRRNRARKAALAAAQRENANKPEAERLEAIRQAGIAFDAANPLPTAAEAAAAARAPRGRRSVRAAQPAAPAVAPEVMQELGLSEADIQAEATPDTVQEREAALRARFTGRADESTTPSGDQAPERSAADVVRALARRVGKGTDKQALAQMELLRGGKLEIVDGSRMENVAPNSPNARGFYDGKKMYINAAVIPEGQEAAGILNEILVHEADHAARLSGNPDAKSKVRTLLGDAATSKLIEQLETSSHPVAVETRQLLADRNIDKNTDPALYEDEITAYAQTAAARQQEGVVWAPIRGLVSAARRKLKQFTGSEDINLSDMAGYGQDVVNALATSEGNINYAGEGRADSVGTYAPRIREVLDSASDTKAQDLLNTLATDRTLPEYERDLAAKLAPLVTRFGVDLRPASENDRLAKSEGRIAGMYHGGLNTIYIGNADSITILHEALHGVTRNLLAQRAGTNADPKLRALRRQFDDMLESLRAHALNGDLDRFPAGVKRLIMDAEGGPMSSVQELLAYGLTEPEVVAVFSELPAPRKSGVSNLWEWFKKTLADFYGNSPAERSFLTDLIDSTAELVTYAEANPDAVAEMNANAESQYRRFVLGEDARQTDKPLEEAAADEQVEDDNLRSDELADFAGRADEAAPAETQSRPLRPLLDSRQKVKDFVSNVATWHGAEGKKMALMVENSEGILNSLYSHALSFSRRSARGISLAGKKLAKKEGISRKAAEAKVEEMVERRMGLIRQLPTPAARDKALANMVREHPDLAPIQEAVQAINMLTQDLIAERMADPTPLTEEEVNLYEYLARNQSGYLTNSYALFQGEAGKKFAKRVAALAQVGYDAQAEGLDIPAEVRAEFRIYDNALKFVKANDVAVSDPEMLSAMSMENVVDIHDMWAPAGDRASDLRTRMQNDGTFRKDEFKDVLSERIISWVEQASDEEIDNLSRVVVNTLLRLNDMSGPAKRYAKASGIDTSILKHRTGVPKPIAELYGKIEDVPTLLLTTVTEMAELTARSQLFNNIRNNGYGEQVVSMSDKARNPAKYENFTVALSGESFGPLQGMYTTPAIANALSSYNDGFTTLLENITDFAGISKASGTFMNALDAVGKVLGPANSIYKAMAIATRPDYLLLNAVGSVSTPILVGGVAPQYLARGAKVWAKAVANTLDPGGVWHDSAIDADSHLAAAMGVMENVVLQDIRTQPRDLVKQFIQDMGNTENPSQIRDVIARAKELGGRGWQAWVENFSMSDAWVRYPVALQRMDFLRSYYEANGDTYTEKQIVEEAANYAKDVTMTASRSPRAVRGAERRGLTMYGNYMLNVPRVLYMNARSTVESFAMMEKAKTPEARKIARNKGIRQMLGQGLFYATATAGIKALADSLMDDDERSQLERDREFLTDPTGELAENQYADLVYVGTNEKGERMYMNLSRADAHGPITDIIRAMRSTDDPVEAAKRMGNVAVGLAIKSAMLGEATKIAMQLFGEEKVNSRPSRLSKIMPEITNAIQNRSAELFGNEAGYRGAEAALQVIDKLAPAGVLNMFESVNPSPESFGDTAAAPAFALLDAMGHKFVTVRPEQATTGAAFRLGETRKEANRQIKNTLTDAGPEAALDTFVRMAEVERERVEQVGDMYHAMIDSGVSPRTAREALKAASLDATTIRNIEMRRYYEESEDWIRRHSTLLSDGVINSPPKKLTDEEKKAWKREAKEVKRRVKIMGYEN